MFLYRTGRTIFVEYTFGETWKYIYHGIVAFLLWRLWIVQYTQAIRPEFTIEKFVHEEHLHNDIDQTEKLAEPITNGIEFVTLQER